VLESALSARILDRLPGVRRIHVAAVMNACADRHERYRLIGWQKEPWLRFRPQEAAAAASSVEDRISLTSWRRDRPIHGGDQPYGPCTGIDPSAVRRIL